MFEILKRSKEQPVVSEDNGVTYSSMTELEKFASATRKIIDGLDSKIIALDTEIQNKQAELRDLRKIMSAQSIALRHMEED